MSRTNKIAVTGALAMAALSTVSVASAADWVFRAGGHYVDPKSDNHAIVNVDSSQSFTFSATRFLTPHWGVELLAALPFEHDIKLNSNGQKVAEVKHLPPTLSLQYHFLPAARVRPYLGAGLNATIFFDEKTKGALAGNALSLETSFGFAAQAGVDFDIGNDWLVGLDARWMDIDTDARLSGTRLGTVSIDPYAIGLTLGRRFGGK